MIKKVKNLINRTVLITSSLLIILGCSFCNGQSIPYSKMRYAVVIKQSTYNVAKWKQVCDLLLSRYKGELFIWDTAISEVKNPVASYAPTHIGFVCDLSTASPDFITGGLYPFARSLDDDPYSDAIWGILTGYPEDVLKIVSDTCKHYTKTILSGTVSCDLPYYTQGLSTHEATSGLYYIKKPDAATVKSYANGPTDRTSWLVSMINGGIDSLNHDPADIFVTSGHGNYNLWQMHYPTQSPEGIFKSEGGSVAGIASDGTNYPINSQHPKIYFGLGNCNIGKIINEGCMAPGWTHKGAAYVYTGYLIEEGSDSYQHGGTRAYYYKMSRDNTWAEAWFLANQALQFDIRNGTPGVSPNDLNGSAFYGDPGGVFRMCNEGKYQEPLIKNELIIKPGSACDTVIYRVTMNENGQPGTNGKWGNRHPAVMLPFKAANIRILSTNAISAVVRENFALLYIWYNGQPSLSKGDTREVVFTCNGLITGTETPELNKSENSLLGQNYPNPASGITMINYKVPESSIIAINLFDINGRFVDNIEHCFRSPGQYNVTYDVSLLKSGIYCYSMNSRNSVSTMKLIVSK